MTATYGRDVVLAMVAAQAVDLTRFAQAVRNTLEKYGTESENFLSLGLPSYKVSAQLLRSRSRPHKVTAGSAGITEHAITLYAPGLACRRSRGWSFNLSVLEVMCHETAHRLSGHRYFRGEYSDEDASYEGVRYVSGYTEALLINGTSTAHSNTMFNEGVTQTFALELMREYLRLGPYMRVTKDDILQHFARIAASKTGAYYPEAVDFIAAIAEHLSESHGSLDSGYRLLMRGYFRAESLFRHQMWKTVLEESGLISFVRKARLVESDELPPITKLIRDGALVDQGPWAGLRVERRKERA